ncbi:precorrin-2 C(20)-methyltransferase [Neosynechococcus sphagnicola]|uniref:precorrin-2 C(20)-methyltransferase n=1 Tax=Neosynechococcus sphagnicola TaxID=1501145 RepID=UPI0006919F50|nr:precorrin-2 C(20)-methyltransferase [Neosynechococcus sphagnicola]
MALGKLYGISMGPGDPELLTLKGLRRLQAVPVIAFPAGTQNRPGLAQQVVAQWVQPEQVQLPLTFPFVQDPEQLIQAWHLAATQVWQYLHQGQDVAFVSEGDVSFYSTFTYLSQTLQQLHPEVEFEAIPGVCSPLAATAALGLPLTIRDQRLLVLPALYQVAVLETALHMADVLVLMKVSSVYEQVWPVLQRWNLLNHSYVIERATQADQVIHRGLGDRPHLVLPYFSLLIVQVGAARIDTEPCRGAAARNPFANDNCEA